MKVGFLILVLTAVVAVTVASAAVITVPVESRLTNSSNILNFYLSSSQAQGSKS
jgi:hypothetical protein